jgi:hypothetical protein
MIKRILKIIIWLICFPMIFPAVFIGLPIGALVEVVIYIATGKDSELDIVFAPMDWAINLPYKFTDRF